MPVKVKLGGVPLVLADAQDAAILRSFLLKARGIKFRDDGGDGDGAYDYTSDDPDGDADAEMAREKETRGYKDAIATKDGEITALKQKIADAQVTDAKLDAMIADRMAVIDAARPLLAKDFSFAGKSLAAIRREAVSAKLGDAAVKDMDDAQVLGAFRVYSADGAKSSSSRTLADGMTDALRRGGGHSSQVPANDASAAYDEMVKRNSEAYRQPISAIRN